MSAPACWMLGRSSVSRAFHRSPDLDQMIEWLPWSFESRGYTRTTVERLASFAASPEGW